MAGRKLISLVLLVLLAQSVATGPSRVEAASASPPPGSAPGWWVVPGAPEPPLPSVYNQDEYREVVFLTGEAVPLTGKRLLTTGSSRGGVITSRISYRLENPTLNVSLTRNLSLTTRSEKTPVKDQTSLVTTVDRFAETVTAGGVRYRLESYELSSASVEDHRPGVNYAPGNWSERRVYSINRSEGTVEILGSGRTVGYRNQWGSTQTTVGDYTVQYQRTIPAAVAAGATGAGATGAGASSQNVNWLATAHFDASSSHLRRVEALRPDPVTSSLADGYLLRDWDERVLRLNWDLPAFDATGTLRSGARNPGGLELQLSTNPALQRLPVPDLVDVNGHWAREEIEKLHGLGILLSPGETFGPTLPMTRGEFTAALARTLGLAPAPSSSGAGSKASTFEDVPLGDPQYRLITAATAEGIVQGVEQRVFFPEGPLTRAQAVTMIVRSLGLQYRSDLASRTPYRDDAEIPAWARDPLYIATTLGLVRGDSDGAVLPGRVLTKGEATALLDRLIHLLGDRMRLEYRYGVINYR